MTYEVLYRLDSRLIKTTITLDYGDMRAVRTMLKDMYGKAKDFSIISVKPVYK